MDMELKWIVEPESTELGKICIIVVHHVMIGLALLLGKELLYSS